MEEEGVLAERHPQKHVGSALRHIRAAVPGAIIETG